MTQDNKPVRARQMFKHPDGCVIYRNKPLGIRKSRWNKIKTKVFYSKVDKDIK